MSGLAKACQFHERWRPRGVIDIAVEYGSETGDSVSHAEPV